MHIKLNNETVALPSDTKTISDLLKWRGISEQGTAVALNGRLAERTKWDITDLKDNDDVVIINAAFGG